MPNPNLISLLLKLYHKSISKQAKFKYLKGMLGSIGPNDWLLDIGSDNGILSHLFRKEGGNWYSADLDSQTVDSIKSVVGTNVVQISEDGLPFSDNQFDTVIVIDLFEHLHDEANTVEEIQRILRPEGTLIVNVPFVKTRGLIRPMRLALGLTDEKHGHLRPGYTLKQLSSLLDDRFIVSTSTTYSRFFSEIIDIVLSLATERSSGTTTGRKGSVMTSHAIEKAANKIKIYTLLYPLFWIFSRLDLLIPFTSGHSLVVRAMSTKTESTI